MADNPNPNIEERIVAAKFDASDFEKGVNKTIKKLDELNDKLDFKKSGESVTDFAKKTSEAQEKASSSLEKLTDRYTTFIGMLKQKFISGVADQVVNVFFRMEKAALSFAKSMTFDQISAGLEKYESALTSVRMIVNSYKTVKNEITGITEKIHYTQDEAYTAIGNLQAYADETSYSMAQMTDAMSKMVSAGVSLDQAEKNVQGIANACAAAGVNATDAARAFYNLSQAYSSGSLKYTDYRSLQLLNMTNENFEEQLIAAGLKAGTLKEIKDKKGNKMYVTQKSATNKKVTAGKKFTRSQAADYLRYGWADTEVMDYLFGNNFYVDVKDYKTAQKLEENGEISSREDYLKNLKDYETIGSWIEKISDKDNEWKKKYESVKDNATERKKIIDQLIAEADLVTKAATKHGKIKDEDLLKWIDKLEDTDSRKINYKKIKDNQKERKKFLDDLRENDADVKEQVKGANLGLSVEQLEKYILTLDKNHEMRKKYDDMNAAQRKTYLKSLIEEAQALGKIKNKYDEIAVKAFLAAREARNLKDVINAIADYVSSKWTKVFENLIGTLEDASEFFTALSEGGIASLFTDFADWVAEVSDAFNLGGAGSEVFRETILDLDEALGNLLGLFNVLLPESDQFGQTLYVISGEILKAVDAFRNWTAEVYVWFSNPERLERIRGIFANLSGVFAILGKVGTLAFSAIGRTLSALSPIFDAVIIALNKITEPIGQLGDKNNTAPFDAIKESLDNLFKILDPLSEKLAPIIVGIGDIFGEVAKFFIGGAIDTAIANIQFFSDAFGLLFELIFGKENSAQAENGHGVIDGIMKGVEDLSNVCHSAIITVGDFFKNLFADLRTLFGLKPKDGETIAEGGVFANITNFLKTNEFIQKAKDWFSQAKVDVQKWFDQAVIDVKVWFGNLPGKITKAISSVLYEEKDGETVATPLKVWLDGAVESVGNFIANIPSYIVQGIGKITDVFGYIIDLLFGKKEETNKEKTEAEKLTEQTITDWRKTFISKIIAALKSIPDQVKKLFENTREKFNKALGTIKKWFKESETGKQIKAFGTEILTGIKNFIISLPENIKKLIQGVGSIGRQVISTIKEIIGIGTIGDEVQDGMEKDIKKISLTSIIDTIIDLGATLANEFLSWFTGVNDIEYNFNWFVSQVVGFIKAIPGKIWDGIMYLGKELSGFWSYIVSQLRHDDTPSEQADQFVTDHPVIANIVKSIVEWVEGIPAQLQTAWSNALKGINEFWSGLTGYWTKLDRINEIQNELKNMDYNDPKRYGLEYELNALNNTKTGFEKNNPQIAEFTKMIHGWVTSFTTTLSSSWESAKITIKTFFSTLPDTLTQAWENAKEEVTQFFNEFVVFWNDPKAFTTGDGEDAERTPTQFEEHHPKIAGFIIGFRKWLNSIPGSLSEAFNNAITGVGSFFKSFSVYWTQLNRIQEIQSKLKDSKLSDADRNLLEADLRDLEANPTDFEKQHPFISGIVGSFHGWISDIPAQLSQTWEWAKTEISTFWNEFIDFIMHPEKWSTNMPEGSELTPFEEKHKTLSGWIISIADFIKNIPATISSTWEEAKNGIITFFTEFLDFITKPEAWDTSNTSGRQVTDFEQHYPNLARWLGTAATWISSLPGKISETWEDTKTKVITFWDEFWTFISNPDNWSEDNKNNKDRELTAFEDKYPDLANWAGGLARSISNLPETLATSFNESKDKLQKFFAGFSDFWSMETIRKQLEGMADGPEKDALQEEFDRLSGSDIVKNFKTDHPVVSDMVTTLVGWVSEIPVKISETMTSVTTSLNNFWTDLVKAFNGDNLSKEDTAKSESLGERVRDWIINFFANLPTYITDGIHAVLGLVNSGFTGLTDLFNSDTILDDEAVEKQITDNAEKALEQLDDTTKQVIEETTNAAGETADDIDKNPTPKDNFIQGIVNIGKTFFDIITKTIPGFIVSGFNWIKTNWSKEGGIKDSLLNIFTEVSGIKPEEFHLENLGAKIGEALKKLPEKVGNIWTGTTSWLNNVFGIKKPLTKDMAELIKPTSSVPASIKHELEKNWTNLGYDITKIADESSVWTELQTVAKEWGDAIQKVFTDVINNIGPFLINAWNGTLTLFGNLFGTLGEWFTNGVKNDEGEMDADGLDEAVENNFGVSISDELKTALSNIGTNIYKLFTETIPQFLGSAIGTVIDMIPTMVSSFLAGLQGALGNTITEEAPNVIDSVEKDMEEAFSPDKIRKPNIEVSEADFLKSLIVDDAEYSRWKETYGSQLQDLSNLNEDARKIYDQIMTDDKYRAYLKNPGDADLASYIKSKDYLTYEELFGVTEELAKKAPDEQAVESAKNGVESVESLITTLLKTAFTMDEEGRVTGLSWVSWAGIGAILVTKIIDFVQMVKDIPHFSNSETVAAKNSINGVMRLAMEALIIGAVFATVASQMNDEQFGRAKEMFDKVVDVIKTVAQWTGAAKIIGTVGDTVSAFAGGGAGPTIVKGLGGFGFAAVMTSITSTFESITSLLPTLGTSIKQMAQQLSAAVAPIGEALPHVESIIELLKKMKSVVDEAKKINGDSGEIDQAKSAIETLLSPLTVFAEVTKSPDIHAKEIIDSVTELMGMTSKMEEFVLWTEKDDIFTRFKYAISSLGSALSFYAMGSSVNVTEISEAGISNAVDFLKAILGDNELNGLSQQLISSEFFGNSPTDIQLNMEKIVMFAGGLAKLGTAAAGITEETGKNINSFIRAMNDVEWDITNITSTTNNGDVTDFSSAMINLGTGISSLVSAAGEITDDSFKSITTILDYLQVLAGNVKGFQESDIAKIFVAKGDLSTFGTAVDQLGLSVSNFIGHLAKSELFTFTTTDESKAEALKSVIRFGLEILASMSDAVLNVRYGEPGVILSGLQTIGSDIVSFINTVGMVSEKFKEVNNVDLTEDRISTIRSVVEIFNEMAKGFGNISKLMIFEPNTIKSVMDALYSVEYLETGDLHYDEEGNLVETLEELPQGVLPRLLEIMKKMSSLVTENEIENAHSLVPMLQELFYALSSCITACTINSSAVFSVDPLNETIQYFIDNFDKIKQLTEKANSINLEDLEKARSLFSAIKELGNAIQSYYADTDITYENRFYSALTAFKTLDYDDLADSIGQFIQSYTDILNDPMNTERLTETGYSMAKILVQGIQSALDSDDDMYKPKVHVVLDDSTVKEQMAGLFGVDNNVDFNISAGFAEAVQQAFGGSETFTSLSSDVGNIKETIDALKLSVDGLQGELTAVQTAFGGMKVFLYKDELVGYITPDITAEQDRLSEIQINHGSNGIP